MLTEPHTQEKVEILDVKNKLMQNHLNSLVSSKLNEKINTNLKL